jgi:hypothetical protein
MYAGCLLCNAPPLHSRGVASGGGKQAGYPIWGGADHPFKDIWHVTTGVN